MFKMLVFLCLFPFQAADFEPTPQAPKAECPGASGLKNDYQSYNSYGASWNSAGAGVQYKVWYVRQEGGYFSGYFYTSNTSYNFILAGSGHYTFYCQTICEEGAGYIIGIEDVIGA